MHTGCQWYKLPIDKDQLGRPEISYSRLFRHFQQWIKSGFFDRVFETSVAKLAKESLLDTSVLHGDGTTTAAKKRGDNIGRSGHKHLTGDKIVALCDRNCNVVAPLLRHLAMRVKPNYFLTHSTNSKILQKLWAWIL